jgi:hypothetical protein
VHKRKFKLPPASVAEALALLRRSSLRNREAAPRNLQDLPAASVFGDEATGRWRMVTVCIANLVNGLVNKIVQASERYISGPDRFWTSSTLVFKSPLTSHD